MTQRSYLGGMTPLAIPVQLLKKREFVEILDKTSLEKFGRRLCETRKKDLYAKISLEYDGVEYQERLLNLAGRFGRKFYDTHDQGKYDQGSYGLVRFNDFTRLFLSGLSFEEAIEKATTKAERRESGKSEKADMLELLKNDELNRNFVETLEQKLMETYRTGIERTPPYIATDKLEFEFVSQKDEGKKISLYINFRRIIDTVSENLFGKPGQDRFTKFYLSLIRDGKSEQVARETVVDSFRLKVDSFRLKGGEVQPQIPKEKTERLERKIRPTEKILTVLQQINEKLDALLTHFGIKLENKN